MLQQRRLVKSREGALVGSGALVGPGALVGSGREVRDMESGSGRGVAPEAFGACANVPSEDHKTETKREARRVFDI